MQSICSPQLKFNADEFDVLPLHFNRETLTKCHSTGWSNILPDYDNYPEKFRRGVVPFLAAALIFHHDNGDLKEIYPVGHPIFAQPIFTNIEIYNSLRGKVILTHYCCDDGNISASGVPALITVSREIREFQKLYAETNSSQLARIES